MMFVPGEIVLEPLENAPRRSVSEIYKIKNYPGLLARNGTLMLEGADVPPANERLTTALFRLSEEYGIEFPGIGGMATREDQKFVRTYATANFVDGFNMYKEMAEVPLEVTMSTLDKMLTYYEDMSSDFSNQVYLADLSLRQCIYGRTLNDDHLYPYFIDYDPRLSNISKIVFSKPFANFGEGFGGIAGLDDDLYALKQNYPDENFDRIACRLLAIANVQGIFYKVPTAYYHVQGLNAEVAQWVRTSHFVQKF